MKPSELFAEITGQNALYNIQEIDNIVSIMRLGLLSHEKAECIEHKSVAMEEIQERRDTIDVPNGMALHQYANVYFDPRNPMLYKIKDKKCNLCILELSSKVLDIDGAVVTDRNASSKYANFYSPEVGLNKIDFDLVYARYWNDEDFYEYWRKKSIKCAEVLVPQYIPYDYVIGAVVCSEESKYKLENTGFSKRIIVKSEMFFEG